jgi:hypothetical protein
VIESRHYAPLLIKLLLATVVALAIGGNVERVRLGLLLGVVILVRLAILGREWMLRVRDQRTIHGGGSWPRDVEAAAGSSAGRTEGDLVSEAVSLVTVLPLSFLLALMLSAPVVVWSGSDRGAAFLALGAGVALHFGVNLIPSRHAAWRIRARVLLLATLLLPAVLVAKARHPYLLAGGETHRRLLAEQVWNLGLSIEAGRHAGVFIDYAKDLERAERWEDAATIYHRALELDAFNAEARDRLADLRSRLQGNATESEPGEWTGLGTPEDRVRSFTSRDRGAPPVFDWSATRRLKVCLVPAGRVPAELLDRAGETLAAELQVDVVRWDDAPLELPAPGRKSAILGHWQWEPNAVMRAFIDRLRAEEAAGRFARGTWQFLLVTDEDLYLPDANYIFAAQFPIHGLVSIARMGGDGEAKLIDRLSKQLISTAIKCFGLRQSPDASCVTAYVRSLAELDRRGRSPSPATRAEYARRVALWESDPRRPPAPPQ